MCVFCKRVGSNENNVTATTMCCKSDRFYDAFELRASAKKATRVVK